jgi:predicted nucleic acid-binding protein
VAALLARNFPATRFLSAEATASLLDELARLRIAGGAVYDALVAACANEHDLVLATRDRRALETYRTLDVDIDFIG